VTHGGGYAATYVPYGGLAVVEELSGHRTPIGDPFAEALPGYGQLGLQPHQSAAIAGAEALLEGIRPA
jgi:hypothetical protein